MQTKNYYNEETEYIIKGIKVHRHKPHVKHKHTITKT